MISVHPTVVVADGAVIGQNVRIGPYCVVESQVCLEDDVVLEAHVVVVGRTTIGRGSHIYPFASLGQPPQDLKFAGEESALIIGPRNIIREHVTMNPGTRAGGMITRTGSDCVFMIGVHVAHDCQIGNHVILVNNATLGGHVHIGDYVIVGGLTAIHQFVRVGRHAMIGGMAAVERDVIPFGLVLGNRAYLGGLNLTGLKRRGFPRQTIHQVRQAYRMLFGEGGTLRARLDRVERAYADVPEVMEIVSFIRWPSHRSICLPRPDAGE